MAQLDTMKRLEIIISLINEAEGSKSALYVKMQGFRSADIAEAFLRLRKSDQVEAFASFDDQRAAEVLSELDDILAIEILRGLSSERIASILNCLPPDEGADVIALSEEEDHPQILDQVDDDLAEQIRDLSTYEPESAGGLMTSHFVSVRHNEIVRTVLFKVKTSDQAETINNIFAVDEDNRLEGVVTVRELLQANLSEPISQFMEKDLITVPPDMDQEEVTRIANKYHLSSLPVIDGEGVLKGIVTFDDLMEVLEEESSEDMYRMAGEVILHPTQQTVLRRFMARFPWLLVTLVGTFFAAGMIRVFESFFSSGMDLDEFQSLGSLFASAFSSIDDRWTFLLCFLPMIGGMAGNVGLQSSTVMVRGFATGEVETSFFTRILWNELLIAATIGVTSGLLITAAIMLIFSSQFYIALAVGLSLFSAILSAAFIGTLTPFLCILVRVDPAYASGPLLTTVNDIFGFLIFFGIAYLMLYA